MTCECGVAECWCWELGSTSAAAPADPLCALDDGGVRAGPRLVVGNPALSPMLGAATRPDAQGSLNAKRLRVETQARRPAPSPPLALAAPSPSPCPRRCPTTLSAHHPTRGRLAMSPHGCVPAQLDWARKALGDTLLPASVLEPLLSEALDHTKSRAHERRRA